MALDTCCKVPSNFGTCHLPQCGHAFHQQWCAYPNLVTLHVKQAPSRTHHWRSDHLTMACYLQHTELVLAQSERGKETDMPTVQSRCICMPAQRRQLQQQNRSWVDACVEQPSKYDAGHLGRRRAIHHLVGHSTTGAWPHRPTVTCTHHMHARGQMHNNPRQAQCHQVVPQQH